jgi:hypothetical protein
MANPSLQIGNGKFAIKENDLLGYSSSGTRFFPIPITMTRATLGTRVNPSGLIEDVELLGSELIQDSDFLLTGTQAENVTGTYWTTGAGWSIANGKATLVAQAGSSSLISTNMTVTAGKIYKVTVNVSATSTGFRLYDTAGVVSYGLSLGENVFYRTPSSSIYTVTPLGLAGATGTISNISVKEYTIDGLARVDYTDGTGSLLVEPQRTNVITYSENFSNAIWTNTAAAISVNPTADLSPDGTLSGNEFDEGTSSNRRALFEDLSVTANQIHTLSVFVKKGTSDYFRLVIAENGDATNWTGVQVDLSDNSLSTNNGNTNSFTDISSAISSTDYNGYYRLQLTAKHSTVTNLRLLFCTSNGAAIASGNSYGRLDYTGTSKTVYVWGAQLEEGSYATSYIKTQGSTVTRNQDQYTKTGISDKINSEEGVLFVEMAALNSGTGSIIISINDGSLSNSVAIYYYSNENNVAANIFSGGNNPSLIGTIPNSGTKYDFNKIALKYKSGDSALWINGIEVFTLGDSISLTGLNKISFNYGNGSFPFFGKVKQLQVFKTALSDSELATLTTQ